ncbi:SCAN domain-containing protein 3-like [Aphis craccivora]|uniref:SCAN domain-containing protein 3-like n=1 Tax=Aphis craccivora TaxID=307492 RepID=A0A6G0X1C8_APHCR|nr:SCAN domain-containing protein 3-like [Aphis craccivora]
MKLVPLKVNFNNFNFTLKINLKYAESFVQIETVPTTSPISLREVPRKCSNLGDQGYDRCNFKQQCKINKCKCRAAGKLCTSKCHDSLRGRHTRMCCLCPIHA